MGSTTAARVVVRSRLPRASALLPAPYASHSRSFTTTARHHHHHPCWSPTSPTSRTTINNSYTSPLVNRLTSRNMASTSSANAANGNGTAASAPVDVDLSEMEYDPVQLELMNEELIVTDTDDNPIGKESKKTPSDGQHPPAPVPPSPGVQRVPLPAERRATAAAEAGEREDHLSRHVDQHLLLPPVGSQAGDGSGGPARSPPRRRPQAPA